MDREGFPLPLSNNNEETEEAAHLGRANRYMQYQDNEVFPQVNLYDLWNPSQEVRDKESGETTTRRIMVLRKPYKRNRQQRESKTFDEVITENPILLQLISELKRDSPAETTSGMNSQLPPSPYHLRERKIQAAASREPQTDSDEQYHEKQRICISTWKEFLLGRGVLHPKIIKFNRQKNGCDTWYKLFSAYVEIIRSCALYFMWIKRILLFILKLCVPAIGARLIFFHFIFSHCNIHREEKEKCLNAKFCGAPFGGVNLYAVRTMYCPFCRDENQIRMTSKYFQSTNQEHRRLAHKMAK